jgi:hypothetical protein
MPNVASCPLQARWVEFGLDALADGVCKLLVTALAAVLVNAPIPASSLRPLECSDVPK